MVNVFLVFTGGSVFIEGGGSWILVIAFLQKNENSKHQTIFPSLGFGWKASKTMAGASNLTKLIKPTKRLQATDIQAAAGWGVVALTGAIWVVQVVLPPNISIFISSIYWSLDQLNLSS